MSVESTYQKLLLELYIKQQLEAGSIPTAEELEAQIAIYEELDLSEPQFSSDNFLRTDGDESSASGYKELHDTLMRDIKVLLLELESITAETLRTYERWENQSNGIEQALYDLESRTGDLVLLARDTEGYVNFIAETFKDLSQIDQTNTTCLADPNLRMATLLPTTRTYHPIGLTLSSSDVSFSVSARGAVNSIRRSSSSGTDPDLGSNPILNAFRDINTAWQTTVEADRNVPVTGTLLVDLGEETTISKISFKLHSSSLNTSTQITPLYSTDGYNFSQLPGNSPTKSVVDTGVFTFSEISAQYIKFLLTKNHYDDLSNGFYSYEFGARLIQFFSESFTISNEEESGVQELISKALYVNDLEGVPIDFSKLSLETCEAIDEDTDISYSITVSNTADFAISTSTQWLDIDPVNREDKENPVLLDVGNLNLVELGETNDAKISYAINSGVPSNDIRLVAYDSSSSGFTDTLVSPTDDHYMLVNDNDRILNYQLKVPLDPDIVDTDDTYFLIDKSSLQIFRNVGEQGLDDTNSNVVRDIQRGWRFENPFYYCVAEVDNADGLTIDVGSRTIWINDEKYSGSNVTIPYGVNKIKVHKDNWYTPTTGANDLTTLIGYDPLYPYNHKMLIEGYSYGTSFLDSEKIYKGVDLFAETEMKRVDVNNFIYNVTSNDYTRYALDFDIPGSYSGGTYPCTVFLVKIDEETSDWLNEKFIIRFKAVDQKYKYLRLKAKFKTEDTSKTPVLMGYKIKIA